MAWREGTEKNRQIGKFEYYDMSESLENSQPLPAAKYFDSIDPRAKTCNYNGNSIWKI